MTMTQPIPTADTAPQVQAAKPKLRRARAFARLLWRTRWHHAPVSVGALLVWVTNGAGPIGDAIVALTLAGVGGLAFRAATHPRERKRMYLSIRERRTLGWWGAGATVWALTVFVYPLEPGLSAGIIAVLTGVPAVMWETYRKPKLWATDRESRALVKKWDPTVGQWGPDKLRGSHVIPGTAKDSGGALVFDVQLRTGVHATQCIGPDCRLAIEALYAAPEDTVALSVDRRNVTMLRVAMSFNRHMEGAEGIPYDGPVLQDDGRVPLAVTPRSEHVGTRMGARIGAQHTLILGVNGSGKTTTVVALLLPPVVHKKAIYVYLDGSHGISLRKSGMTRFMTEKAFQPDRWRAAIDGVHALMVAREVYAETLVDDEEDEGDDGDDGTVLDETFPEVYLVIEEAPEVATEVPESCHEKVRKITARGRKVKVGVVQIAQGANAEDFVGGVKARGNATQIIAHRPMDPIAMMKALQTVPGSKNMDLMGLPGEPGWVAIIDRGMVWPRARVKRVTKQQVRDLARGFEPIRWTGIDEQAIAPYLPAIRGEVVAVVDEPVETAEQQKTSRDLLVDVLRAHGPSRVGQIAPQTPDQKPLPHECAVAGCPGWTVKYRQTAKHLLNLEIEGVVAREGDLWSVKEGAR